VAKQKKQIQRTNVAPVEQEQPVITSTAIGQKKYIPYFIISLFVFAIYANSLWNTYAIDDTLVLTDNTFTKKGIDGVKDIFTHDAFVGFFGERGSKLVSGGRYRPLSIATLAVEYEISRKWKGDTRDEITDKNIILGEDDKLLSPMLSHFINIVLFIVTCLLLFSVFQSVFPISGPFYYSLAFIATMLFAGHPIHTEAVTNIKGRDEIMGLLFALATLRCVLKFVKNQSYVQLVFAALFFFLGLLSKENTITFFAVIPLTLYFFTTAKAKDYIAIAVTLALPIIGYLAIRTAYTEAGVTADSPEILNNPFAYTNGNLGFRYATTIYTFILYIKLLLFPINLTHDYYFNQIPYVDFSDIGFLFSLLVNGALVVYALVQFRKKTIPSYAILFYFITFSIVSNLLFTVGILMNERFMFFSSVGFCLLIAYLLLQLKDKFKIAPALFLGLIVVILSLYSVKTFSRNFAWENNFKLFMTDVEVSTESAKIHTSCGGDLTKVADRESDTLKKKELLNASITHLRKAIQIYPNHSNAWLMLGNAVYKLNHNPQEALTMYEKAKATHIPPYYDALYDIGVVQMENGMVPQSIPNFRDALAAKPDAIECKSNLAEAYFKTEMWDSAMVWYGKVLEQKPNDANAYYKMGTIYGKQKGNLDQAIIQFEKAISLNPKVEVYYEDLAVAYGFKSQFDKAIETSQRCLAVNPKYLPAIKNLFVSYNLKGDKVNAMKYAGQLQMLEQQSR
jgi:tetratricopeptide (TPR) repeat protein